jgi:hypothetical protein
LQAGRSREAETSNKPRSGSKFQITSTQSQTNSNSEAPSELAPTGFGSLEIGPWTLFGICDLVLVISPVVAQRGGKTNRARAAWLSTF